MLELNYEHSDNEALAIGNAALRYILDGSVKSLPLAFRGAAFYGVVRTLRENDDTLHADPERLTVEQQARREEIESDLEKASRLQLQFYPFGHKQEQADSTPKHMDTRSSWDASVNKATRSQTLHIVRPPSDEVFAEHLKNNTSYVSHSPHLK